MIMEVAQVHARIHHVGGVCQSLGDFRIFDFGPHVGLATPSLMMNFRKWLVELRVRTAAELQAIPGCCNLGHV